MTDGAAAERGTPTTYTRSRDLLLSIGLTTQEQLEYALREQKKTKHKLGRELIEERTITEQQLIETLRAQLGAEPVDLSSTLVQPQPAELLPKKIVQKYSVVPVRLEKGILSIVTSDPINFVAIEEVKAFTRKHVIPMIATAKAIDHVISKLYGNEGAARVIADMKREMGEGTPVRSADDFIASVLGEEGDTALAPMIRLVSSIIECAVLDTTSDIHVEPHERELLVRMWVDGIIRSVMSVPKDLQGSVVLRLKVMGGMDVTERRILQDGRAAAWVQRRDIDMRLSTFPTTYGEKVVIRLLDKDLQLFSKDKIGPDQGEMNQYMSLISRPSGIVLIVGPTGSGKSSAMYTMIRELSTGQVNLVTLEGLVEYSIEEINQAQISEKTGLTSAGGLRSTLCQDPDIVVIGEIRDGETAQIAMRAAITGHLVPSTIRTNDALATINHPVDVGVGSYTISGALNGITSQRLVCRTRPNCRQECTLQPDDLLSTGLDPYGGHKLYRGAGCPSCFGAGYRGRTVVFGILVISYALRMVINRNARREELETTVDTGRNFVPLVEGMHRLVFQGVTIIEEARRIVAAVEEL